MRRLAIGLGVCLVAPAASLAFLALSGGLEIDEVPGLPTPGWTIRAGLPVVQSLRDVFSMLTVGLLTLAACCMRSSIRDNDSIKGGAFRRSLDLAAATATLWATMQLLLVALIYSDASGARLGDSGFAAQARFFATEYELGRYLLAGAAIATVISLGCLVVRTSTGVGVLALCGVAGLWTMALTGHAAGSLNHSTLVNLQFFHLVSISVWAGGLVALVVLARRLDSDLSVTVGRFSTLAGWCLALVTVTGVVGASLRLQQVSALWSSYGALVAIKLAVLGICCGLGWWQRRRLVRRLAAGEKRAFIRIASLEGVVLGVAAGAGVALSRTDPPSPPGAQQPLTAAQSLLGSDPPPALSAARWFTEWSLDLMWLVVAISMLVWYLRGVVVMRRRGDTWSAMRTGCWCLGWIMFLWATNGAPGAYGRILFSMHMVQHMTIATAVPALLVLGAPVTLAMRTWRRRTDGSAGPREWLHRMVISIPVQILGTPVVAAGLFVVGLVAFYSTSLFETSLESHTAHVVMVGHFLLSGYLLANCLVGIDPGPARPAYPLRVLLVMVTFAFHALFSVSLMASDRVLGAKWFDALGLSDAGALLEDQRYGASLGWILGDYPLALLAIALVALWVQTDVREQRRFDRRERRTGDAELAAYNESLRRLSERPATSPPRRDVD